MKIQIKFKFIDFVLIHWTEKDRYRENQSPLWLATSRQLYFYSPTVQSSQSPPVANVDLFLLHCAVSSSKYASTSIVAIAETQRPRDANNSGNISGPRQANGA